MKITDELINRFFQGQCNQKEAAFVAAYLEQYGDSSAQYLGEEEWNEITSANNQALPETQRDRMFANISKATVKQRLIFPAHQRWSIAASLFLIVFSGLFFYHQHRSTEARLLATATPQFATHQVYNPGKSIMLLTLKDGSKVQLYPDAKISFANNAFIHERTISLTGKAFFKVVKDKKRPFTVISGTISTTALGTAFMVDAGTLKSDIRVQLFEGRVVVKSKTKAQAPVFMNPLQEFIYEKQTGDVHLTRMNQATPAAIQPLLKNSIYDAKKSPDIIFVREPIEKVFLAIQQAYDINLTYPKGGLKNYYFSGSFNLKEDSLGRVLHIISETNNLNIIKIKSGYSITKSTD